MLKLQRGIPTVYTFQNLTEEGIVDGNIDKDTRINKNPGICNQEQMVMVKAVIKTAAWEGKPDNKTKRWLT